MMGHGQELGNRLPSKLFKSMYPDERDFSFIPVRLQTKSRRRVTPSLSISMVQQERWLHDGTQAASYACGRENVTICIIPGTLCRGVSLH